MPDYRIFDILTECGLAGQGWKSQEDCDCAIKSPHATRCAFEKFDEYCDFVEGADYGSLKNTGD